MVLTEMRPANRPAHPIESSSPHAISDLARQLFPGRLGLTVEETGRVLGIGDELARKAIRDGTLPSGNAGRQGLTETQEEE